MPADRLGQRAGHYGIAAYDTLGAWARTIGHDQAPTCSTAFSRRRPPTKRWRRSAGTVSTPPLREPRRPTISAQSLFHPAGDLALRAPPTPEDPTMPNASLRNGAATSDRWQKAKAVALRRSICSSPTTSIACAATPSG